MDFNGRLERKKKLREKDRTSIAVARCYRQFPLHFLDIAVFETRFATYHYLSLAANEFETDSV